MAVISAGLIFGEYPRPGPASTINERILRHQEGKLSDTPKDLQLQSTLIRRIHEDHIEKHLSPASQGPPVPG